MSNLNLAYAASGAFTITLGALAASSSAGRQSDVISNTSSLYLDYLVGGKIETGTSPGAGTIEVWAFAAVNDTPTYPAGLGATNAAIVFTSRPILVASMRRIATMVTDTTSNRTYWFSPTSIAALFGGMCPFRFGIVVVNNGTVALNATDGNHVINYKPVYMTVA